MIVLLLYSLMVKAQFCGTNNFTIKKPAIIYPNKAVDIQTENFFILVENRDSNAWAIRLQVSTDTVKYPFTEVDGFICQENNWNYTDDVILHNRSDVFRQGKPQHIIPLNFSESGSYFFTCRAGRSAMSSAYAAPIKFNVDVPETSIDELLGEGSYLIQQLDHKKLFKLLAKQTGSIAPSNLSVEEKWSYYQNILPEKILESWFWFYQAQYYWERNYLDYGLWCLQQINMASNPRFNKYWVERLFRVKNLKTSRSILVIQEEDKYRNGLELIESLQYDSARVILENYLVEASDNDKLNTFYWLFYLATQQEDFAKQEAYLLKGYELAQRIGNDDNIGSYAYHLGCFYKENNAILSAKEFLDIAHTYFLSNGNAYALGKVDYQLGLLFSEQGSIDFSIDYLDNARIIASFVGDLPLQINIYRELIHNLFALQDCKTAENYTETLQVLEDSLQRVRLREIEFIANIRLAEEAALTAQLSEASTQRQLLNFLFLLLIFGIITIISIGTGVYLYRQGKELKEKDKFLQAAYFRETKLNTLLKEVYRESIHRSRNYFSILGATINKELRRRKKEIPNTFSDSGKDFLSHLQQKIFIFRNINEALSGISTQNLDQLTIDVIPILKTLQSDFQLNYPQIKFECVLMDSLLMDYHRVEIICLIIHETIINAIKHAFDERCKYPAISFSLVAETENNICMLIKDNGKGMSNLLKENGGLKRIKTFVTLLNGTFSLDNKNREGTSIVIRFIFKSRE